VESIFHLRHQPKSGNLRYRQNVPQKLRSIVGKGKITSTLESKVLDHTALIRWVEIDQNYDSPVQTRVLVFLRRVKSTNEPH